MNKSELVELIKRREHSMSKCCNGFGPCVECQEDQKFLGLARRYLFAMDGVPEKKKYDEKTMEKANFYGNLDEAKRLGWNSYHDALIPVLAANLHGYTLSQAGEILERYKRVAAVMPQKTEIIHTDSWCGCGVCEKDRHGNNAIDECTAAITSKLTENIKTLPPEIAKLVDEHFWDLLAKAREGGAK
ncbi:MAG: hypothetical protein WC750_06170 [Patescibacteria group bacterium]|jgi:hypothetical protein